MSTTLDGGLRSVATGSADWVNLSGTSIICGKNNQTRIRKSIYSELAMIRESVPSLVFATASKSGNGMGNI